MPGSSQVPRWASLRGTLGTGTPEFAGTRTAQQSPQGAPRTSLIFLLPNPSHFAEVQHSNRCLRPVEIVPARTASWIVGLRDRTPARKEKRSGEFLAAAWTRAVPPDVKV